VRISTLLPKRETKNDNDGIPLANVSIGSLRVWGILNLWHSGLPNGAIGAQSNHLFDQGDR
jgi:hypothetical protein